MEIEENFWNWFLEHKVEIAEYLDSNQTNHEIFNVLNKKIYDYNEFLFAEITGGENGKYILVLTCDGRREGVHPLTKLAHFAPKIDNWTIQQFRQPGHVFELNYRGLKLQATDFRFKHWVENDKHQIDIYMPNYSKNDERNQTLAFLYLDHFIGEFKVITEIGSIGFKRLSFFTSKKDLITLSKLSEIINN